MRRPNLIITSSPVQFSHGYFINVSREKEQRAQSPQRTLFLRIHRGTRFTVESLGEFIVVMKSADYPEKKNNVSVCTEGAKDYLLHETSGNQMPRLIPVL